jgi:HAD superfamily hydrolase (TIGR01450 family)
VTKLHKAYDVALLDLDGVVYIGGTAIPGAPEALQAAKRSGMRLAYVTNNASRTPAAIADMLRGMNVPADAGDVVTSAQAAARLLADRLPQGAPVLVLGSTALRLAVTERGLRPVSTAAEHPLAVVQGYNPGIGYQNLAEGGLAVRAGALFVGTNADSTIPSSRGIAPGNGSLLRVIAHATGKEPVIAGKPEPPLHNESVIRTGAKTPLVVGDRLDTDIEAAYRAGVHSLLVLTGVSRPADVLLAPPRQRPSYVAQTLDALLEPYPEVTGEGDGFCCGGWTALGEPSGQLALKGAGAAIDGLRALCAAAWHTAGDTAGNAQSDNSNKRPEARHVDAVLAELADAGLRI